MTFRSRLVAVIGASVLLASACGGGVTAEDVVSEQPTPSAVEADTAVGQAGGGPDLGLLGQGSLEGRDVVVWFWAEW